LVIRVVQVTRREAVPVPEVLLSEGICLGVKVALAGDLMFILIYKAVVPLAYNRVVV